MNTTKLKKLFEAARGETAPPPPPAFAEDVLRAVRREPAPVPGKEAFSVFEQLNALFPRVAFASVAVIVLGLAADFGLSASDLPDLNEGLSQISAQWFFTPGGL